MAKFVEMEERVKFKDQIEEKNRWFSNFDKQI